MGSGSGERQPDSMWNRGPHAAETPSDTTDPGFFCSVILKNGGFCAGFVCLMLVLRVLQFGDALQFEQEVQSIVDIVSLDGSDKIEMEII